MTETAYFEKLREERRAKRQAAAPEVEEPFTLLETKIPLGELPSTAKRIMGKAAAAGFLVEGYESRVRFADAYFKTGDRRGELKKPAYEQRNIFLGGHVPQLRLRFYASWLGSKFSAHIHDPVGRYRYANSRQADERETYWMEKSTRAFEKWLAEWGALIWDM